MHTLVLLMLLISRYKMKGKVEFDQQKSYFFLQEIISFTPIFADEIRYCRIYKMF